MSFLAAARANPRLSEKAAFFEDFWKGEGPCPILFAKPHLALGLRLVIGAELHPSLAEHLGLAT